MQCTVYKLLFCIAFQINCFCTTASNLRQTSVPNIGIAQSIQAISLQGYQISYSSFVYQVTMSDSHSSSLELALSTQCDYVDDNNSQSNKSDPGLLKKYSKAGLRLFCANDFKKQANAKYHFESPKEALATEIPKVLGELESSRAKLEALLKKMADLEKDLKVYISTANRVYSKDKGKELANPLFEEDIYEVVGGTFRKVQPDYSNGPESIKKDLIETATKGLEYVDQLRELRVLEEATANYARHVKKAAENLECYTEQNFANNTVYFPSPYSDGNKLWCFDAETKTIKKSIPISRGSTVTQIGNRVFISGGYTIQEYFTTDYFPIGDHVEYKKSLQRLIPRASMAHGLYGHTTIAISGSKLVTIGGTDQPSMDYNTNGSTRFQEYDIEKDTWKPLVRLNRPHFNAAAVLYNQHYLYAVGGTPDGAIERLDLIDQSAWEVITLGNEGISLSGLYWAGQVSDTEVLILNKRRELGLWNMQSHVIKKSGLRIEGAYNFTNGGFRVVGRAGCFVGGTKIYAYEFMSKKLRTIDTTLTE
eukprot:TRINITY_DN4214_c0_g1_i1.p1 TRINITY_DN4214_c0_g1~~TRINITY_DN4214_c0_g1_i1.p1  ORF type:complete len:535 (-),score=39.47 TRINITY_DN4214_c0_g1_i1:250-1854(-)